MQNNSTFFGSQLSPYKYNVGSNILQNSEINVLAEIKYNWETSAYKTFMCAVEKHRQGDVSDRFINET